MRNKYDDSIFLRNFLKIVSVSSREINLLCQMHIYMDIFGNKIGIL